MLVAFRMDRFGGYMSMDFNYLRCNKVIAKQEKMHISGYEILRHNAAIIKNNWIFKSPLRFTNDVQAWY